MAPFCSKMPRYDHHRQNSDIQNVLYDKKTGDEVTLKISYVSGREYQEKEVKVTL